MELEFTLWVINIVVQHVNVKKEICANLFVLTRPCGSLENAPRAKFGPRVRVCGSLDSRDIVGSRPARANTVLDRNTI